MEMIKYVSLDGTHLVALLLSRRGVERPPLDCEVREVV